MTKPTYRGIDESDGRLADGDPRIIDCRKYSSGNGRRARGTSNELKVAIHSNDIVQAVETYVNVLTMLVGMISAPVCSNVRVSTAGRVENIRSIRRRIFGKVVLNRPLLIKGDREHV